MNSSVVQLRAQFIVAAQGELSVWFGKAPLAKSLGDRIDDEIMVCFGKIALVIENVADHSVRQDKGPPPGFECIGSWPISIAYVKGHHKNDAEPAATSGSDQPGVTL